MQVGVSLGLSVIVSQLVVHRYESLGVIVQVRSIMGSQCRDRGITRSQCAGKGPGVPMFR